MNAKEERFVAEFLIDGNATRAAMRAGYSRRSASVTGHRLLRKANVAAAIAEARGRVAQKAELTAKGILTDVQSVFNLALKAGQYSAALKAQELLGRHLGMWATPEGSWREPKREVSTDGPTDIVLARRLMYFIHRVMQRQANGADPGPSLPGVEH